MPAKKKTAAVKHEHPSLIIQFAVAFVIIAAILLFAYAFKNFTP